MKNELEQKKNYIAPKMEVIYMEHEADLLVNSTEDPQESCDGYCGDLD